MNFTFTEEQRMMAGAFRELLEDICAPERIRALYDDTDASGSERWQRLTDMGLPGMLAREASGGLGLVDADFVLIAEEAGRAALPEPLIEHAGIAVPLLTELPPHPRAARLLEQAAAGEARIALVHAQCPFVNAADETQHWIVCRQEEVHLLERAQIDLTAEPSLDLARKLFRVDARPTAASRIAQGDGARDAIARAAERGSVYAAAQCLGLAERMTAMAVEYATQRVQFGKPIGSYQAIKHQLANVQVRIEFARPVVHAAATRVSDLDARALAAVSHAKLAAGDAADAAARTAMQVHGAMGYSWEVDLHFYMKRAWALIGAWGDRSYHARRVQSLLAEGRIELGPDQTFAGGSKR